MIVILRGPSATGKTTIAKALLQKLKNEYKKDCAFIAEDDFRKKMQFKYKAIDKKAHLNSAEFIKSVIKKLNELDTYEIIIIEGLFRHKEMIDNYSDFCKTEGHKLLIFQLEAPIETRKERNKITETRDHTSNFEDKHVIGNKEETKPEGSISIDTTKPLKNSVNTIITTILKKTGLNLKK